MQQPSVAAIDGGERAFAGETVQVPTFWFDPRDLEVVKVTEGRRVAISMTIFPLFKPSGEIDYANRRWREYTGFDDKGTRGAGWLDAVHPDDRPGCVDGWQAAVDASSVFAQPPASSAATDVSAASAKGKRRHTPVYVAEDRRCVLRSSSNRHGA